MAAFINDLHLDLTIIITTSPIKSHPSTNLLDSTINSFNLVDGLNDCRKIIMCDGWTKIVAEGQKQAIKSVVITEDLKNKYLEYVENIRKKAESNEYKNAEIYLQEKNNGFAENVKIALYDYVRTPYVIIVQHDQEFKRSVDLKTAIERMKSNDDIKYIGMMSDSDQNYVKKILARPEYSLFYKDIETEINSFIWSDIEKYHNIIKNDPEASKLISTNNLIDFRKDNTDSKVGVTNAIINYTRYKYGLPLMPIVFWYDKTHICSTEFYKKFVFGTVHIDYSYASNVGQTGKLRPIKLVSRFIEDTLGAAERGNIKRHGICAFKNYGTYVLYDNPDKVAIYHADGRSYLTPEEKEALIEKKRLQAQTDTSTIPAVPAVPTLTGGSNIFYNKYMKYKSKYIMNK